MNNQIVETITFPHEEWVAIRNNDSKQLVSVQPVPGTWTLLAAEDRMQLAKKGLYVKGLIACPRCKQSSFLLESFDPPKELGDGKPPCEYKCAQCGLVCRIILKDWDRRKLYCACYETIKGEDIKPHKQYLHAVTDDEARHYFWAQHRAETTHLVAIAPVIGFFAEDKDAKRLVV
jgi:hypothetical protein